MSYVSFQEMKPRVGIDDVAFSLGYKLNRQAGVGRYIELILPDGRGEKLDTIVISHPQEKDRQRYFHRNTGKRGDVVDFIGENLNRFNKYGRNQWEVIGKVMADFANMPIIDNHDHGYAGGLGSLNPVFNPKRYTAQSLQGNMDYAMGIFEDRGLSQETVRLFERHIAIVTDQKNKNGLPMIGFPYREPGFSSDLAGYELRGDRGFKGKAAGTNSTTAVWTAGIHSALNNPQMVRHVYFCESAFDAMSFYQANRAKIDLPHSAFVSVGGALSNGQVSGLMSHYCMAKAVDCFDNDLPGRIYGMRMAALLDGKRLSVIQMGDNLRLEMEGKAFDIPVGKASVEELGKHVKLSDRIEVMKPPVNYKDWNDVVRGMPLEALQLKTKFQRDENLARIRTELRERNECKIGFKM
jgi:signal peptidase I